MMLLCEREKCVCVEKHSVRFVHLMVQNSYVSDDQLALYKHVKIMVHTTYFFTDFAYFLHS